jgi:hypothetical protein
VYIAPASLAVAVALLFAVSAAAAPAPFGAYLGCYNLNRMELSSEEMRVIPCKQLVQKGLVNIV